MYINTFYCITSELSSLAIIDNNFKNTGDFMKKIMISLVIGLIFGYGASAAMKGDEISKLKSENAFIKKEVKKMTSRLLVVKNQLRQAIPLVQSKNLMSEHLNGPVPQKKGMHVQ